MTNTDHLRQLWPEPIIHVMKFEESGTQILLKVGYDTKGGRSIAHVFHDDDADKVSLIFKAWPALLDVVDAVRGVKEQWYEAEYCVGDMDDAVQKMSESLAKLDAEVQP